MSQVRPQALRPFAQNLVFPEAPRWHAGALWCSDILAGQVLRFDAQGQAQVVLQGVARVSGLGWLPDGRMLAVAGHQRQVLRQEGDQWQLHADLSALVPAPCNDMVVDAQGRAYVGNWGFQYEEGEAPRATVLVCVQPHGQAKVVADGLLFPNGCVVTPDGATLVVAETFAGQLTAFSIDAQGDLSGRRVWAAPPRIQPDGICLDAEGAIWLASPPQGEVLRVLPDGEVTHRVQAPADPLACVLGGPQGRTLFIMSTALFTRVDGRRRFTPAAQLLAMRCGRIDTLEVAVPGVGRF